MRAPLRFELRRPTTIGPLDVGVAACGALINLVGVVESDPSLAPQFRSGGAVHAAAAVASGLALAWRRDRPVATFAFATVMLAVVVSNEWPLGWMPLTWLVAAYAVGAHTAVSRGAAAISFATAVGALLFARRAPLFDSWLVLTTFGQMLLIWLLGAAVRARRVAAEHAGARAVAATAGAAAAEEAAARAERRRVARELHDSVTNSLSVVVLHAAALRRSSPGDLDVALAAIEDTGRAALADLRRMLGALRGPDDGEAVTRREAGRDDLDASLAGVTGWTVDAPRHPPPQSALYEEWPVDLAIGLTVVAINVTGSVVPDDTLAVAYREPVVPALVLLAAAPGIALVARRRHALAGLFVTLASLVTISALGWQTGSLPGTVLVASFAVAAWSPVTHGVVGAVAVFATMSLVDRIGVADLEEPALPLVIPLFAAPWIVGAAIRRRRAAAEHAERVADAAERDLTARQMRAAADERQRVAEDLTDLVAHGLAAVVVQAAAARRRSTDPALSRGLSPIESAGRAALDNLRVLLDLLRSADAPSGGPAPGVDELVDLVAVHRDHHGPVELDLDPSVALEGASTRLAVFRIVQEALCNVGRHAPGASSRVAVTRTPDGVEVVVEDDGCPRPLRGAEAAGGGLGLLGMRERVVLHGGRFDAGATSAGGFRVAALLATSGEPSRVS